MGDTDKPATERTVEKAHANLLERRYREIAVRLRDLADAAEREADHIGDTGKAAMNRTYAQVASRVQHDILWGLANLHLDSLTDNAQQADEYRIKGE